MSPCKTGLVVEYLTLLSKQQLFARIVVVLVVEQLKKLYIFGESEITTGAAGDLQQITRIARQVILWKIFL